MEVNEIESITESLVKKLAPPLFLESEGGGYDLGLWFDSGELTESEYLYLRLILSME